MVLLCYNSSARPLNFVCEAFADDHIPELVEHMYLTRIINAEQQELLCEPLARTCDRSVYQNSLYVLRLFFPIKDVMARGLGVFFHP